jgi:hypothetical protein
MMEAYRLASVLIQTRRYVGQDGILRRLVDPLLSPDSTKLADPRHHPNPVTNA